MPKNSKPTPRRADRPSTRAKRSLTTMEVTLLLTALLALALGGPGGISASGDVNTTTIIALATAR